MLKNVYFNTVKFVAPDLQICGAALENRNSKLLDWINIAYNNHHLEHVCDKNQ